jgi:hypothetical protein
MDFMDYIKKTAIEPVLSLQYVISDFLQEGKEKIEGPLLDEFKKDIFAFKEELEDIALDFLDDLGNLLDQFNNKYGKFLKLEAAVNFSVKKFQVNGKTTEKKEVLHGYNE